jgi:short-subunit dehydrogenase
VVTGASSGIGRELARLAAKAGYDAVLVARRQERLDALAAELAGTGVTARPVVADLSQTSGVDRVLASLAGAPVDVLINDAGVGGRGAFAVERDLALDLAMIRLDVLALVELTGRLLPGMVERVAAGCSTCPPSPATCPVASKAFVKSFSLALAEETRGTGVRVSTLCPGPVRTEFAEAAGYRAGEVRSNALMPIRSAAEVAAAGWDGLMAGRSLVVPDLPTRIGVQALRFVPWQWVMRTAVHPRRDGRGDGPRSRQCGRSSHVPPRPPGTGPGCPGHGDDSALASASLRRGVVSGRVRRASSALLRSSRDAPIGIVGDDVGGAGQAVAW